MKRFLSIDEHTALNLLRLNVGDWKDVQDVQQQFASMGTSAQSTKPSESSAYHLPNGLVIKPEDVKQVLEKSCFGSQELAYGKLKDGALLLTTEKTFICRTLCSHYFAGMLKDKITVTSAAKHALAKCIVEAYDCLRSDNDEIPPEADWYYKNNGEEKGEDTGFIFNWVHNNKSKYRKSQKKRKSTPLTPEIVQALEEFDELPCDPENYEKAETLIKITFQYRNAIRAQKECTSTLLQEYRKLLAYDGKLLQLEFNLMYAHNPASPTFREIEPLCLMLSNEYDDIASGGIRLLMSIKQKLKHRGISLTQNAENLSALEEDVATFVRFLQHEEEDLNIYQSMSAQTGPLIVCANVAFAEGKYHVYVDQELVWEGFDFYHALDLWFKAHHVFSIKFPQKAAPTTKFFEALIYNVQKSSRSASVNSLVGRIKNALKSKAASN